MQNAGENIFYSLGGLYEKDEFVGSICLFWYLFIKLLAGLLVFFIVAHLVLQCFRGHAIDCQ